MNSCASSLKGNNGSGWRQSLEVGSSGTGGSYTVFTEITGAGSIT